MTSNYLGPIQANSAVPPIPQSRLIQLGVAMRRNQSFISKLQWTMTACYLSLLCLPIFLPMLMQDSNTVANLRSLVQYLFWGIWWPSVMVTTMTMGRVWCGVFCPDGALTEFASRHGLKRPIPHLLRWGGWPFITFVYIIVYGHLVSAPHFPQAALLVLGSCTVAGIVVGYLYGRGSRVWCRYLCPLDGVFGLLAKIAPLHVKVDEVAWKRDRQRLPAVNCAPLINIARMKSASACHVCGRCSGQHDAVELALRSPAHEILSSDPHTVKTSEAITLIFGMIGSATIAFSWSKTATFAQFKTVLTNALIDGQWLALLQENAPWWLLSHYPEVHRVFTWLDAICILVTILGGAGALGSILWSGVWLAAKVLRQPTVSWQRLSLAFVPLAGTGLFLNLSSLTLNQLEVEGISISWAPTVRGILLAIGASFSAYLILRMCLRRNSWRTLAGLSIALMPLIVIVRVLLSVPNGV